MTYADLAEVQRQSTPDVLRLLAAGDPRERVWAAWTLGLRGGGAEAWLADRARVDPTPGVRRHLAVMMAGFGRTDSLWSMAKDPHPSVRATALHWLCRLSGQNDVIAWDRIMPRFDQDVAVVRAAILRGLPDRLPLAVDERWPLALEDADVDIRRAALERFSRRPQDCMVRAALLANRLDRETDPNLLLMLRQLLGIPTRRRPAVSNRFALMRLS